MYHIIINGTGFLLADKFIYTLFFIESDIRKNIRMAKIGPDESYDPTKPWVYHINPKTFKFNLNPYNTKLIFFLSKIFSYFAIATYDWSGLIVRTEHEKGFFAVKYEAINDTPFFVVHLDEFKHYEEGNPLVERDDGKLLYTVLTA